MTLEPFERAGYAIVKFENHIKELIGLLYVQYIDELGIYLLGIYLIIRAC